jgi:hypothetical protein
VADLSPAVQARLLVYVRAQARARSRIQDTVVAQVAALLRRVLAGRWYDEAAVAAAATQLDGVVGQGQAVTRDITLAYLNQALLALGVVPPRVAPTLPDRLRPVPVANAADVSGYRRVIHPELSRSGTCGLCIAAADRIYKVDDLMPIHTSCACEPMPIVRGVDPARVFNGADTTELYRRVLAAAGGETAAAKLRATRVQVSAHGELGPVLHDAGHRFRDQGDVVGDLRPESVA